MMQERRMMMEMMLSRMALIRDDVQPVEAAKPQKRYVPKRAEPAAAAPVRRRRDSAGDPGTQKAKKPNGKAACKKKAKPE